MFHVRPTRYSNLSIDSQQLETEIKKAVHLGKIVQEDKGQKKFLGSSHRAVTPHETLSKLNRPQQKRAGITRVADITDLDVIGIPTYVAIRPEACFATPLREGQISIYNGKGFTKEQAKASALMEAFERCSAEPFERTPLIASYQKLAEHLPAVDPASLNFTQKPDPAWRELPIEWMMGVDLFTGKPTAVPAVSVFFPYVLPLGTKMVNSFHSTTGLASGNTFLEATVHALLEVMERHGTSPQLTSVKRHSISPKSIQNNWVRQLLRKLQRHQITVGIKYHETSLSLSIFRVWIDDPVTHDPYLICDGAGCHLSRDVALIRAITEAVQSRLTIITGTREDIEFSEDLRSDPLLYKKMRQELSGNFEIKNEVNYKELPHFEHLSFHEDLSFLLDQLKRNGYGQAVVVNLTRPNLNIPVVRVVVPHLFIQIESHDTMAKVADDVKKRKEAS